MASSARREVDPRYVWSNAGHVFLMQERERAALRALQRHGCLPLAGKAILEVGCGAGTWLRDFIRWGAWPDDLTGKAVAGAARQYNQRSRSCAVSRYCG